MCDREKLRTTKLLGFIIQVSTQCRKKKQNETSKISAFSVSQIPGRAKARLPQDTHLAYSFLDDWRLCAGQYFLWAVLLLGKYFFIDLGEKATCFAFNFLVDPNKMSTDMEWAEVGLNRGLAVLWLLLGLSAPRLSYQDVNPPTSWKTWNLQVEMWSHYSGNAKPSEQGHCATSASTKELLSAQW